MWVDDNVGDDSLFGERHVFLRNQCADDAFLSVSGSEFVSKFGYSCVSYTNFDETVAFDRFAEEDGVYDSFL